MITFRRDLKCVEKMVVLTGLSAIFSLRKGLG